MGDGFYLGDAGLTPLSNLHTEVADGLGQLTGTGAPVVADIAQSFGNIAFGVNTALGTAADSRMSTLGATKDSSSAITDLLKLADQKYREGDQAAGDQLTAAAQAMEGQGAAGQSSGSSSGSAGDTGGSGTGGEMIGQIGQQVGQAVQSLSQGVTGLAQGLTQFPQQVMQSVMQAAGGSASSSAETGATTATATDRNVEPTAREDDSRDRDQPGAAAGENTTSGPAPDIQGQPAQTRPQQSPL